MFELRLRFEEQDKHLDTFILITFPPFFIIGQKKFIELHAGRKRVKCLEDNSTMFCVIGQLLHVQGLQFAVSSTIHLVENRF